VRESTDLSGRWWFQPDPAGEGVHRGWFRPECDVRHWREVGVPASFDTCMPILEAYEGDGWFRRVFSVPADWRGRRVALRFEGVNYHASVWLNGERVGDHDDGFLPFEFAVQDVLRFGEENTLVVRADNTRRKGEAPGMRCGWRPDGGILREVRLIAADMLRLDRVSVVAEPTEGGGRLAVRAEVRNDRADRAAVSLDARLMSGPECLVRLGSAQESCLSGQSACLSVDGIIAGVEPWSPDRPRLYDLRVALAVDGRIADEQAVRVGFRRVEARDSRLYLNGQPIYLTGFNRHEDSARAGMCPDMERTRQDLLDMKAAGANFVRLCHYPHHPGELDLCDELGILAMGEIPLYWWDGLAEGAEDCARKLAAAERQLAAMIRRDINHPSVIFWSASNETHEQRPEVVEGNAALLRLARSLDPTRLATHASNRWHGAWSNCHEAQFEHDDVICVNAYPSLNQRGYGGRHGYDFAESTRFWREELARLHARHPEKPILVSEFGYASLEGVLDSGFGEDAQADALAHEFAGMDAPYVCGAVVWCWADHPWPQSGFCRNMRTSPYGVLTRDRRKLRAYWTLMDLFRQRHGMVEPMR
jgi:beta-glucuronidase